MNKSIIPFAALALTLAGCSNEEGGGNSDSFVAEGTPITVNTLVGELTTKAGYAPNVSPAEFYLRIKNSNNSKYSYYAQMKNDNDAWKSFDPTAGTTLPMYWAGDSNPVNVTAATFDFWDATTSEAATSAELTISSDQSDDTKLKACDHLMQLTTPAQPNNSGITVSLSHIMAKLHIVVDLGKDNTSTSDPLSKVQVSGTNLTGTYNFADLSTAAWADNATATKNVADITVCPVSFTAAATTTSTTTNATAEYEAIIVPQEIAQGEFGFHFDMGNKTYIWKSTSAVTLDANTLYTLKMKMNGGALSLSSVITTEWGTERDLVEATMSEDDSKGTLTIKSETGGEVTEKSIAAAIDGKKLKIVGAINSDDVTVLAKNETIEELDLSDATILDIDNFHFYYTAGSSAQIGNKTLTKVVLPEGMTYVPKFCFHFCTSLTSVTLPNSVTQINGYAFAECSSLTSIELPDGLTEIGNYALAGTALESISLPSSLTTIGSGAFESCTSLKEITIPANVSTTYSSQRMFSGCTNLSKVTYLSSAPTIQSYEFENSSVGEIYLPNCSSLPEISTYAFKSYATSDPDLSSVKVYVQSDLYTSIKNGATQLSAPWTDLCVSWAKITANN